MRRISTGQSNHELTRRSGVSRWLARLLIVALLSLMTGTVAVTAARQVDNDFSPASGHAQVIAQGVVEPPSGDLLWRTERGRALPAAEAPFEERPTGFVLATSAPMALVDQGSEALTRLGPGEATFVRAGTVQQRVSLTDGPANYLAIDLLPAGEVPDSSGTTVLSTSQPFTLSPGPRDLDLVRDVLTGSETLTLPETGETNVVLVTAGSLTVSRPDGAGGTLIAGEAATFSGELLMSVAGGSASADPAPDDSASVAIAVIGAAVPAELRPDVIPEPPPTEPAAAAATEPTEPEASPSAETGTITVQVANCPPGMRPETLAVAVCATTGTDFDVTLSAEALNTTLTLADATAAGPAYTWMDLPFGDYLLAEAVLPVGYDTYVVTGPNATGDADTGIVITLDAANAETVIRIYNFATE